MIDTKSLADHGPVIPVIVLQRMADAVPLARALVSGGVKVLEITLRTPVALECMRAIAQAVPEAIVGAGTIRTVEDAKSALEVGCQFGVSPEALAGGALARVRDGDVIRLDGVAGTLEAKVDPAEWAARDAAIIGEAAAEDNGHGLGRELFAGLRRNVVSAEEGACSWM